MLIVSPVLHNKEPVKPEAVNTELPQLLATSTVGAHGVVFGAANTTSRSADTTIYLFA